MQLPLLPSSGDRDGTQSKQEADSTGSQRNDFNGSDRREGGGVEVYKTQHSTPSLIPHPCLCKAPSRADPPPADTHTHTHRHTHIRKLQNNSYCSWCFVSNSINRVMVFLTRHTHTHTHRHTQDVDSHSSSSASSSGVYSSAAVSSSKMMATVSPASITAALVCS